MTKYLIFKFFTSFIFINLSFFSIGQTLTIISLEDNQPIPGAKLTLVKNDTVFHFLSKENGEIELEQNFQNTSIKLTVSFIGFETKTIEKITLAKDTVIALINDVKEFEEIAITAQYKSQLVENAVHNIKVIDRQKIALMAAQNLKDVLSNELNIRISEDDILGSSMQIQGIGGENIKILIDDVPLTGRLNGNIDLSQIPLDNIERIEVVEGPLSVSYGTDALAGTINIITKKNQANKFEGSVNNYLESSGKINNTASLGWQIKKHQIRLEGGRYFFDGWDPTHQTFHFNSKPIADSTRTQLWKPKIQVFGGINYRYNRQNSVLNYSGQLFNENVINKGKPRPPYQETAFDDYYNTKRINQRLLFEYRFKNDYRLSFIAAYNGYFRRKNTFLRDLTEITDVLSADKNDHDTSQYHSFIFRGKVIQSKPHKKLNYEVGYDILHEIALGKRILSEQQTISDFALYATSEYTLFDQLTFRPGIRYSYNTEYNAPITPSINLKYDFWERKNHQFKIRASYARGFRSPSIKELHYTFIDINHNIVGNPDLKAENANNYNFSLHHDFKKNALRVRNKTSVFYTDIRQMITLALAEGSISEYSYFNLERFSSSGIQWESSFNWKNLSSGLGVAYIGRKNYLALNEETNTADFMFSPELKLNLQYNWRKTGIQTALFYKYTGVLPNIYRDENGTFFESNIGDYHTADFTVSKHFWKNKIKFTAGIKNIFDVRTIEGTMGGTNIAEAAHASGSSGINIGTGRTYHLGILLQLNSN